SSASGSEDQHHSTLSDGGVGTDCLGIDRRRQRRPGVEGPLALGHDARVVGVKLVGAAVVADQHQQVVYAVATGSPVIRVRVVYLLTVEQLSHHGDDDRV